MTVQLHANHIIARFDVEAVPVVLFLLAKGGRREKIDTAARVLGLHAIENLDLVAEVRGGLLIVGRGAEGMFSARVVANRDSAVAALGSEVFHMQIVLAKLGYGVEP